MLTGLYQAKGDTPMGFRKLDELDYSMAARPTECLFEFIVILYQGTPSREYLFECKLRIMYLFTSTNLTLILISPCEENKPKLIPLPNIGSIHTLIGL